LQKKISQSTETEVTETKEETKESAAQQRANELDKLQKKGQVQMAPTKEEKLAANVFLNLKSNKGKKKKAGNSASAQPNSVIDFQTIKKFNDLKITAPLAEEDFERASKDLDELVEALIYWGNIIQRQNKIRFIKNSRKISSDEDYMKQAEDEEKFIESEKAKFEGENEDSKASFSLEKLKIAHVLDRESRMRKAWNEEDDDDVSENDEEDDRGFTAEDMGDEENPIQYTPKPTKGSRGRGGRTQDGSVIPDGGYYKKPKQAQRPKPQNFKAINNQEQFPTLENQFEDDEEEEEVDAEEMGETPNGEIS